ncbi:MAG: hypothetical protein A2497_05015 [Candidatus Firestonebacteria bacterium RifOxyC12_full_39_7]|nr:MAG: hypothetical protein A2497_05015 [Candidatus Firestonebacteria bacterium RifOxyC12_full_39_7]
MYMNLCGLILQKRLADRLSGVSANGIQFIIHAAFIHGVTSVVFCGIFAIKTPKCKPSAYTST